MVRSNKPIWKLVRYDRFQSDFLRLSPEGQWIVKNTLNAMVHKKNPTAVYQNEVCDECLPDLYLFGVHDDGIGNKKLALLIHLDRKRKILCPVSVYKARLPNHTN